MHPDWSEGRRHGLGRSHIHMWWIKIREGYLRSEESQPHTKPLTPGLSARRISPHNFWLQKPVGIESVEETFRVPGSFT